MKKKYLEAEILVQNAIVRITKRNDIRESKNSLLIKEEKQMTSWEIVSFAIDTELTPAFFNELLKFIRRHYLFPLRERFTNIKKTIFDNKHVLVFRALEPDANGYINVEMRADKPIQVKMVLSNERIPKEHLDLLKEDLVIAVQVFEEQIRKRTLYFAWVEGEQIIPERLQQRRSNIIYRLFSESMLLLFVIFIVFSIIFFIIFGIYAPILLVAIQFIMVLSADRIILRTGEWRITEKNPKVHLLEYQLPIEEHREFQQKMNEEMLIKLKKGIYEKTFAVGKPLNPETCENVFSELGLKCRPENLSTKIVNVYEIVKKVADKFKLPIPKIAITNTMMPNAAATGPSPSQGVVVITTGLLVQLENDEIESVVGHEFSHLKGRDPLALFGITALEFLLRIYVFWPVLFSIDLPFFVAYLYLFLAFSFIYFIAKFFEARADLDAAVKIGQPKVLATALRKIGFRRLQFERTPSYRLQEWIGWDPHPPIYFRVARLEKLEAPDKVKHTLIQSIKDNVRGFIDALS